MGRNTLIVEFFGLPASGKSTLCESLKSNCEESGLSVKNWNDVTHDFKSASVLRKILCIPYDNLIWYILLFITSLTRKRALYYYTIFLKIEMIYRYAKATMKSDYLWIEHGVLQHMMSFQCGHPLSKSCIDQYIICKILQHISKSVSCVNCNIPYNVSMERMLKRNRTTEGRLDKIMNTSELEVKFRNESAIYDYFVCFCNNRIPNFIKLTIDMIKPVEVLTSEVLKLYEAK